MSHHESIYISAYQRGWLDEITKHMPTRDTTTTHKGRYYWTFDKCAEEAKKYSTKTEFRKNAYVVYQIALSKQWFEMICSHMSIKNRTRSSTLTKEYCLSIALQYKSRYEFMSHYESIYISAYQRGWLDDITHHMIVSRSSTSHGHGYWTFDRCAEEAKQYKTKREFRISSNSVYQKARKND
jgi:hypothetical protein